MPICDVLLIVPPNASLVRGASSGAGAGFIPPLGLGYLAAVLEQAGYRVDILDMDVMAWRGSDLVRWVQERQPRVVGFSLMVGSYNTGLRAAQLIRNECPPTKIVVGGPQATFLAEEILNHHPAVDVVACHEGELTLLELMQAWETKPSALESILGIAFRREDGIHQTPPRPLIKDLDTLPLPARHLFQMKRYAKPGVLLTARGCVGQCVFCAARATYPEQPYRARSPQAVMAEIAELSESFGLHDFFIADDAFTLQPKRALAICDLIIASGLKAHWTCEARVNSMTPDLVHKMHAAGCHQIFYGVETGDPEVMKLIRKGIRLEQVEEVVNFTQAAGIDVMCSFILGFPWDTPQTIGQTIEFAGKLRRMGATWPNRGGPGRGFVTAAFYHLTPLPGTFIFEHASELGLKFLSKNWDHYTMAAPIIETAHLSAADLREWRLRATRSIELERNAGPVETVLC